MRLFVRLLAERFGVVYEPNPTEFMTMRLQWPELEAAELPDRMWRTWKAIRRTPRSPASWNGIEARPCWGWREGWAAHDDHATGVSAAVEALLEARLAALERRFDGIERQLGALTAALPPVLLTIPEAAAAFKVSIPTMRRWVRAGEVPTVRIGGTLRVDMSRVRGTDDLAVARAARDAQVGP